MYFINLMDVSDDERDTLHRQVDQARVELFTLPEKYIQYMDAHPPEGYLVSTDQPFLILQGGKDFQVYADVDFVLYKEIAQGRGNIEFRLYDELNHLFTRSTMEFPTTDDYIAGTPVDSAPLADIAAWLLKA